MKYPSYDREKEKKYREDRFHKAHMPYGSGSDSFLCPNGRRLIFREERTEVKRSGFSSVLRRYVCKDCPDCPFGEHCPGGGTGEHRRHPGVNRNLEAHKDRIRRAPESDRGRSLIKQRGHDVESCFGDIKGSQLFRRVHPGVWKRSKRS